MKLLIIEDSAPIQRMLLRLLEGESQIEVVGVASTTKEADLIRKANPPDVITLDLHLPEEDGVSYLRRFMATQPTPTLVVTSFNIKYSDPVFQALEAGAFDCIEKPTVGQRDEFSRSLVSKVLAAAKSNVRSQLKVKADSSLAGRGQFSNLSIQSGLIAIGASTGGTEALKTLLTHFPASIPPVVIVQHMPPVFTERFAARLKEICPFDVCEAQDGQRILSNCVYIAPGGRHMKLREEGAHITVQITEDPPVNLFRPSVDYLFESVVKIKGRSLAAMILTGMGGDGAQGLLSLKKAGASTLVQNEETCVVFGMPKVAIDLGAADLILPIEEMAPRTVDELNKKVLQNLTRRRVG